MEGQYRGSASNELVTATRGRPCSGGHGCNWCPRRGAGHGGTAEPSRDSARWPHLRQVVSRLVEVRVGTTERDQSALGPDGCRLPYGPVRPGVLPRWHRWNGADDQGRL